jgi:hypothetical protein
MADKKDTAGEVIELAELTELVDEPDETALVPIKAPASLVTYEAPADVVARATEQADVLMDIVESKKLYANIQGKRYLTAEAWETILAFNNVSPLEVETVAVKGPDGQTFGWKATVALVDEKTGIEVARASMIAGLDDFPSQGRTGTSAHRAAMSAAQTWAVSKAARIKFSWVAVLAGYEPTPANEMIVESASAPTVAPPAAAPPRAPRRETTGDICPKHGTPFYPPSEKQIAAGFTSPSHKSPEGFCSKQDLGGTSFEELNGDNEVEEREW